PDVAMRNAGIDGQPRAELKRRPIMVAPAKGNEDPTPALRAAACEDSDIGGGPLEEIREIGRHANAVYPRGRIDQHQVDVVCRREPNSVAASFERRKCCGSRACRQRCTTGAEGSYRRA